MFSSTRRPVSSRAFRPALVAALALCLAAPLSASAATTRYASPTGAGPSPCLQTAPCSLERALSSSEGLTDGDTVLLAPGTYHPAGALKVDADFVTVAGESGQAPPLIMAAGERGLFLFKRATVRDLRIHSPASTFYGLTAIGGETVVERVESAGEATEACAFNNLVARDVICATTAASGVGLASTLGTLPTTPVSEELKLYNITAVGEDGLFAGANGAATVKIEAFNSIFRGTASDIAAHSETPLYSRLEIELSHSNFATIDATGGASVSSPTVNSNQEAAPLFVDAAAGNYREQEGSPTRLAGDLGVILPGETDLAGNPRTTNCAGTVGVDIGAYQFECPAPVTPPPAGQSTGTVTKPAPTSQTPPSLSKLVLKPAKFKVSGKGPKGTTISFTLSTAATVKLEVLGKKTVKGKKKTVTLGTLPAVDGKAGTNRVKFAGKLRHKALGPGKYVLRATAGAAGLTSPPVSAGFEVLIP